jgi:hypothetical protein
MENKEHVLVGKVLRDVLLAKDQQAIKFVLADGSEIIARCDVDCCSSTWIEDVNNPEFAVGSEIVSAVDIDMPEGWMARPTKHDDRYEEEMEYYGFKITTAKGVCTIEYRNSSNGYYGGNLSWPGEYYYGGVYEQNESKGEWQSCVDESFFSKPQDSVV